MMTVFFEGGGYCGAGEGCVGCQKSAGSFVWGAQQRQQALGSSTPPPHTQTLTRSDSAAMWGA